MTDKTKHLLAKEVYFFFKWLLVGCISSYILYLILHAIGFLTSFHFYYVNYKDGFPCEGLFSIFAALVVILPFTFVFAYLYRIYKWVMKWK